MKIKSFKIGKITYYKIYRSEDKNKNRTYNYMGLLKTDKIVTTWLKSAKNLEKLKIKLKK